MNNESLAHYGVKGMKWGVRREIKQRSIAGARIGRAASEYSKRRAKLENKIENAKNMGASTKRLRSLKEKRNSVRRVERLLLKTQKKLYSGISKADIEKGSRYVKRMDITGAIVGGHLYNIGAVMSTRSAVKKYASSKR